MIIQLDGFDWIKIGTLAKPDLDWKVKTQRL